MSRVKCLILGASGLVGQRLQQRLVSHPMFEIGAVAGSLNTAGKSLRSIPWRLSEPRPDLPEL
ncbi:MAG: aspartate-semialdehyde dehydrogenase, partial [Candidatus Thermoplasmatota archaeon]|nr:aspartate-semialdehyde dehydrogenase [Candidatus Thermoplasmatota archaeon]